MCDEHFKFYKIVLRHYSGGCETFTWFCGKCIQETVCQISSESPKFCRRYYKNILVSFFWTHCINNCVACPPRALPYVSSKCRAIRSTLVWKLRGHWKLSQKGEKMCRIINISTCIARLWWNLLRWCIVGLRCRPSDESRGWLQGERTASNGNAAVISTFL